MRRLADSSHTSKWNKESTRLGRKSETGQPAAPRFRSSAFRIDRYASSKRIPRAPPRCQRDPSPSLSLLFLYTRFEIKFALTFFLFFLSFSNKNNFVITISGKFEKIIIQLHLLLIVEWKLLPNCRLYISLNIGNWTRFYEQKRFSFFLFQRRSARNLSRNACHTSLVESNGATVLTYRHFVMRGASFPSSIVSHLGRASTGKKEHRQSGARFVSTVSDSRRRSAPWKLNALRSRFYFSLSLFPLLLFFRIEYSRLGILNRGKKERRNRESRTSKSFLCFLLSSILFNLICDEFFINILRCIAQRIVFFFLFVLITRYLIYLFFFYLFKKKLLLIFIFPLRCNLINSSSWKISKIVMWRILKNWK